MYAVRSTRGQSDAALSIRDTRTVIHANGCKHYGHPEFKLDYRAEVALDTDARAMADLLVNRVAATERFEDGQLFQMGWVYSRLQLEGSELTFKEPDFRSMPVAWDTGVTSMVRHRRLHRDVLTIRLTLTSNSGARDSIRLTPELVGQFSTSCGST